MNEIEAVATSQFNDAATKGMPVRLVPKTDPPIDAIALVPQNAFGGPGRFAPIGDPTKTVPFYGDKFLAVSALDIVGAVAIDGKPVDGLLLPGHLGESTMSFVVRKRANADVYRVEVFEDPEDRISELKEIRAGTHVQNVQKFEVRLAGRAVREFRIAIYAVDRVTARRDWCEDAEALWMRYFKVTR